VRFKASFFYYHLFIMLLETSSFLLNDFTHLAFETKENHTITFSSTNDFSKILKISKCSFSRETDERTGLIPEFADRKTAGDEEGRDP